MPAGLLPHVSIFNTHSLMGVFLQPTEETKIMPIFKILPSDSIQEVKPNCKPKIQEMEKYMGGTRIQMEQKGWLRQTLLRNTRFLFFFW